MKRRAQLARKEASWPEAAAAESGSGGVFRREWRKAQWRAVWRIRSEGGVGGALKLKREHEGSGASWRRRGGVAGKKKMGIKWAI